ncbi:fimbrial protein [Buttiauxella gaviniae]|uniref:fimbrial protein n=1 Tax=Buttiauxella gaviniae TaxID=82990 RepID=UPI003975826D
MRITSVIVGYLVFISLSYSAFTVAAQPIKGYVRMGGQVVESACALHPDSHERFITTRSMSTHDIIRNGGSELHPFSIDLINCSPSRESENDWSAFRITFEGAADGSYFALHGNSQGLAIEIQDDRGHIAVPGIALASHPMRQGGTRLHYYLRLVGNAELLRVGNHFALIKYKIDYY